MSPNPRDPMFPCPDCKMLCGTKDAMLRDRRLYYRCARCLNFFDAMAFIRSKESVAPTRKAQRLAQRNLASIFGDETPSLVMPIRDDVPMTSPSAVSPNAASASPPPPVEVTIAPPSPMVAARAPSRPAPPLPSAVTVQSSDDDGDDYEVVRSSELENEGRPFDVTPLVAVDPNALFSSSRSDSLASSPPRADLRAQRSTPRQSTRASCTPVSTPQALLSWSSQELLSWSSRCEVKSRQDVAFLPTKTSPGCFEAPGLESVFADVTPSLSELVHANDFREDMPLPGAYGHVVQTRRRANDDGDARCAQRRAEPSLGHEKTAPMEVERGDEEFRPSSRNEESRSSTRTSSIDILALPPSAFVSACLSLPPRESAPRTPTSHAPPTLPKNTSFDVDKPPPSAGERGDDQDTVVIRRKSNVLGRAVVAGSAIIGLLGVLGLAATKTFSAVGKADIERVAAIRRAAPAESSVSVAAPRAPMPEPPQAVLTAPLTLISDTVTRMAEPMPVVAAPTARRFDANPTVEPVDPTLAAPDETTEPETLSLLPSSEPAPVRASELASLANGTPKASPRLRITEAESLTDAGDRAYRSGSGEHADELYRRALSLSPSYVPARLGAAEVAWDQGRRDEARARYRALIDDDAPGLPPYVRERAGKE